MSTTTAVTPNRVLTCPVCRKPFNPALTILPIQPWVPPTLRAHIEVMRCKLLHADELHTTRSTDAQPQHKPTAQP